MANTTSKPKSLPPPTPMAGQGQPVDWMFAFKFNGASFPGCNVDGKVPTEAESEEHCIFGGTVQPYPQGHSQRYVFATSKNPALTEGKGCLGATPTDPLGATFGQIYNNPGYFYVVWNDQFNGNPLPVLGAPHGHSKGIVAWNADGNGVMLQVSTPSWPGSGSSASPRQGDGNTLGCIKDDDIELSQHFFAIKINAKDLAAILTGLANSSVVTDPSKPSIVRNGGPANIQALVNKLGTPSTGTTTTEDTLSTAGIRMLSKPSALHLPCWHFVSSKLDGLALRVASFWAGPKADLIPSTTANTVIPGWPAGMAKPGAVEVATTGTFAGKEIGLAGSGDKGNHAKIGISQDSSKPVCVFGDLNQTGTLGGPTVPRSNASQNGRGGLFFVLENAQLHAGLTALLKGQSAPIGTSTAAPAKKTPAKKTPAKKAAVKKAAVKSSSKRAAKKAPATKGTVKKTAAKKAAAKSKGAAAGR